MKMCNGKRTPKENKKDIRTKNMNNIGLLALSHTLGVPALGGSQRWLAYTNDRRGPMLWSEAMSFCITLYSSEGQLCHFQKCQNMIFLRGVLRPMYIHLDTYWWDLPCHGISFLAVISRWQVLSCLQRLVGGPARGTTQSNFYPLPLQREGEGVRGRNGIGPKCV